MKDFKNFLTNDDDRELDEAELNDAMWDFIAGLDETVIESLDEDQVADYVEIIEAVADEGDDNDDEGVDEPLATDEKLSEAMPAKRVRRDVIKKRQASREHRKVKAKKKLEGRRKRKTASFKRYKKKSKRLGKRGLTSTGKRKRTYINKG
jgi:hypothetical protein